MSMPEESANQISSGRDVFVSYASQDAVVANSIVESLEAHGLKCWMAPRNVKPGAQYAGEAGWLFNATQCRVEPAERRHRGEQHCGERPDMDVRAGP
jgi:hypothetical protein